MVVTTMSSHTLVRPLADAGSGVAEVGGKGASLAALAAAGLPVPPGFHVTTDAYRTFVDANDLDESIMDTLAGLDVTDHAATEAAARRIQAGFVNGYLPTEISAGIRSAYRLLGQGRVAVRSSATAEDLPGMSFAGQQDSVLDIGSAEGVLRAVRRCWASLWNARAITYRVRQDVDHDQVALAVLVQRMINSEASGVIFTVDPMTRRNRYVTINSAWGLGEAVVGGEVTPDVFKVGRRSGAVTSRTINAKSIMTVRAAGGTTSARVPDQLQHQASLSDRQASRLAALALQVVEVSGAECDIEWARTGDDLYVLQARPVTDVDDRDPWNDSRSGHFLWTNTNVGEAIPDVMTPAAWSMTQVFLHDAMATASIPPYVGYGRIGGRIYLNVSVMSTLSAVVGVSEANYRRLTEEVFGRLPEDLTIPRVRVSPLKVLAAVVPVAAHVLSEARREVRVLNGYLDDHRELCRRRRDEIAAAHTGPELATMWRSTIQPEFHKVSRMLSAATRSSGASFVTTRKRLQALVGDAQANAITAGLGSQAGELASLGLLDGLDRLGRGEIDEATFADTYGHRGPHEFEISTPRPGEDSRWVSEQLALRRTDGAGYRELLARQVAVREQAWRTLEYDHPIQARILHRQIALWATISRNRERARGEVIRYFWVLRAWVLRAGELTGLGNDIFFLDAEEIAATLGGAEPDRAAIAARRAIWARYDALPPFPTLIVGRFDPFAWALDPDRRTDVYVNGSSSRTRARRSQMVQGFPGSAGVVEGVARVLATPEQAVELQSGEVLVTTVTNVGWTPTFPRASAVVTDVGAPLSHAAIVARELGIPAVVGTTNATMVIATGDRVRVDGSAGTVEVLRP